MTLFTNKYRVESTRLQCWDYSENGEYFVTICTKNSTKSFGDIQNEMMGLNDLGNIAAICLQNIPSHFPFVELGALVIMPNHVHGIIIINKPPIVDGGITTNESPIVETQDFASLHGLDDMKCNKFGPQSKNLASIIRGFKIGVTKYARQNNINFSWQPRFYDHIILNDSESEEIEFYILNNPRKWYEDHNNPTNLWI